MCGIAGQAAFGGGTPACARVERMAELLHHRGPDHQAVRRFGATCLAHTRLSLLDLSPLGHQPFADERYALVYNGEIYNFRELRSRIEKDHGVAFVSQSDTEVLFHSLIHDGLDATLARIEGMFAFAFLDRATGELTLVRDRLGIKPLFFHFDDRAVTFASELKALTETADLTIDEKRLVPALSGYMKRTRRHTIFHDVFQVVPGTYVRFDADGRKTEKTWFHIADLIDPEQHHELSRRSHSEVLGEFERRFTHAVRTMLMADAPIGAFVSGGVDSSLIAQTAHDLASKPHCYTVDVAGRHSEIAHARKLADLLDAPLHQFRFEPEMFLRDWVATTWANEAPVTINPHAVPFGNLTRLARATGDKAVLTGEGADELFLGYPVHVRAAFDKALLTPWRAVDALYRRIPGLEPQARSLRAASQERLQALQLNYDGADDEARIEAAVERLPREERRLQAISLQLTTTTLHALLWRNDRMGMMNSIESRFPFLDESVLRFAANLPVRYKVRRTSSLSDTRHPFHASKYVVRALAAKHLPRQLTGRRKRAFPVHGHADIAIDPAFFKGGFWQDVMRLGDRDIARMCEDNDRFMLAHIASLDIWGRLFRRRETVGDVERAVTEHCRMMVRA